MYVTVDVDEDEVINEIDSERLKDELNSRGEKFVARFINSDDVAALVQRYQVALYQGDDAKALEAAKDYFYKVHSIG